MIYHQHLAQRYDETYPEDMKFDHARQINPRRAEFKRIDESVQRYFRKENGYYIDELQLHEKIALAEVNLRTRGLVGMVLGSMVPRLVSPPDHLGKLHKHTDIDVLILNEFGKKHPRPFEWGVDWFARPPNGFAPTNGLVRLWYDIEPKSYVSLSKKPARRDPRLPFYLDAKALKLKYKFEAEDLTSQVIGDTRTDTGNCLLRPGLYLPSADIMRKIAENANRVKEELARQVEEARELTQTIVQAWETSTPFDGSLLIEAMNLCRQLNDQLDVLPQSATEIKDEAAFLRRLRREHGKLNEAVNNLRWSIDTLGEKGKTVCEKDYSYLDYSEQPTERALYPILSEDLLTFKPI